ncbi:hypothetical protein B0J12DRAFT_380720 [Macrophomina phaseolina]|uniref:Uncharacterized protein n=1 Tax=Macrophomina phaseolina TaxID=35725 RepID=A0ABQ8GKQ6_9PEZI|nr:hypothetical protein B0J12DRAFT_380720 [Macrophomina phaseolina]
MAGSWPCLAPVVGAVGRLRVVVFFPVHGGGGRCVLVRARYIVISLLQVWFSAHGSIMDELRVVLSRFQLLLVMTNGLGILGGMHAWPGGGKKGDTIKKNWRHMETRV